MKRLMMIALLCFLLTSSLVGLAWAQGDEAGTEAEAEQVAATEQIPEAPAKPSVMWGDYRYTFTAVGPSSDIDPQSVLKNWFTPSLHNATWQASNYVHLYITIEWMTNDRSLDYMPLQLVLVSGGRRYILFGKNGAGQSYIWRRGNHYKNDVGCRYPDHVGDDAKIIFTFDTNGAAIDPNSAYIEVHGLLDIWNWGLESQLYYDKALEEHYWGRLGSSYFTSTKLADIPLAQILNGT